MNTHLVGHVGGATLTLDTCRRPGRGRHHTAQGGRHRCSPSPRVRPRRRRTRDALHRSPATNRKHVIHVAPKTRDTNNVARHCELGTEFALCTQVTDGFLSFTLNRRLRVLSPQHLVRNHEHVLPREICFCFQSKPPHPGRPLLRPDHASPAVFRHTPRTPGPAPRPRVRPGYRVPRPGTADPGSGDRGPVQRSARPGSAPRYH